MGFVLSPPVAYYGRTVAARAWGLESGTSVGETIAGQENVPHSVHIAWEYAWIAVFPKD